MATQDLPQDFKILGSILDEFHFETTPIPLGDGHRSGYGPTKKVGAAGLNTRHPAYGVIGRQIDAAAVLVRKLEEFLNRPGTLCIPVHLDIGVLQYWPKSDDYSRSGSPFGAHRVLDPHTQYSIAIVRTNDKWRVAIYKWTIFGIEMNDRRGRSKPSRKPWLESSYMDKAVTLSGLPKLFEKLLTQVALLVRVASTNEEALIKLGDIVKSIPTS